MVRTTMKSPPMGAVVGQENTNSFLFSRSVIASLAKLRCCMTHIGTSLSAIGASSEADAMNSSFGCDWSSCYNKKYCEYTYAMPHAHVHLIDCVLDDDTIATSRHAMATSVVDICCDARVVERRC